jgi:hypothetical protein
MSSANGNYGAYGSYPAGAGYGQQAPVYGAYGGGAPAAGGAGPGAQLRRRHAETNGNGLAANRHHGDDSKNHASPRKVVKSLDFMFPKVDHEFTIQTEKGGLASMVAVGLICLLCLAEIIAWIGANQATTEHVAVDTSLGRRMQVNLNITFPALACEDLHLDVMDVAGDSQLDIDNTLTKTRLRRDGRPTGNKEQVDSNIGQKRQSEIERVMKEKVPENYCGPCYGAQEKETDCCNTCDELMQAYLKKQWRRDIILTTSEQCIREGRHKKEPKRMTTGEGCNLVGHMTINRVAGNFHIAMGEGIERNGRHIHTFQPDDTPNFNASHIIHHLSFGTPTNSKAADTHDNPLNGVSKIVDHQRGTTGLFQYFIKIVPTTYISRQQERRETNGFFFTERFRPLMQEYFPDDWDDDTLEDDGEYKAKEAEALAGAPSGHGHHHHDHHDVKKNSILPGVFFIYEIYPFAVEITENSVTYTHLLIRLMATVGGVFTTMKLVDTFVLEALGGR